MIDSTYPAARQTILIVDNAPENIDVLNEVLAPFYRIKIAVTGERALKIAMAEHKPDLILLIRPGNLWVVFDDFGNSELDFHRVR